MAAYPVITTYPPLGQLSIISSEHEEQISLALVIEWSSARPEYSFGIEVCFAPFETSRHPSTWTSTALQKSTQTIPSLQTSKDNRRKIFTGTLPGPGKVRFNHIRFAVKYRTHERGAWQWPIVAGRIESGEILWQLKPSILISRPDQIHLVDGWKVKPLHEPKLEAASYLLESIHSIPQTAHPTDLQSFVLGHVNNLVRYFGLCRIEAPWIGPRHGTEHFYLAEDAVMLSCVTHAGLYVTLIAPPSDGDVYTVLRSNDQGDIVVACKTIGQTETPVRVCIAVATTLEGSICASMHVARDLVKPAPRQEGALREVNGDINGEEGHAWLDGLTYCTYNALGTRLTSFDILTALAQLRSNGVGISALLIDETYQSLGLTGNECIKTTFRGAESFEADPTRFPDGLKALIKNIKSEYGIAEVGVWHTLSGYWGGLASKGQIQRDYQTTQIEVRWGGQWEISISMIENTDIDRYFDEFYSYLRACGITFVKTDGQNIVNDIVQTRDRKRIIPAYQSAWNRAHRKYFGNKAISCMSMVPEMLAMQFQNHQSPIVLRNSDDFFPEIPQSHPWHIWANAHNGLLTRHLNVVPDWDMFQTNHEASGLHAAARCISGGPVYITDNPGQHDIALIQQMTGFSPWTKECAVVLRPASFARTINAFNGYGEGQILKIGNETVTGVKLLGLFNMTQTLSSTLVSVDAVLAEVRSPGVQKRDENSKTRVVVQSFLTAQLVVLNGKCNRQAEDQSDGSLIQSNMPGGGYDIWSIYRSTELQNCRFGMVSVVTLGLLGKMSGAAAVYESSVQDHCDKGFSLNLRLKALGTLGVWLSSPKIMTNAKISIELNDGAQVAKEEWSMFADGSSESLVRVSEGMILQVDLLKTWDRLDLWSQEYRKVVVSIAFE